MTDGQPRFTEYGIGGDQAGARRSRRAFRLSVAAVVFLTVALWFSETYLRYGETERVFRAALTLDDPSARPLLRQAVKVDAQRQGTRTSQYVEALAPREEADLVLPTYAEAFSLNPSNSYLAIRYGCELFLAGQFQEAAARFRHAAALPPENALPLYLEAAATLWLAEDGVDASGALAQVARANARGFPVVFPKPVWFPGMPRSGMWYRKLERNIVDKCCAPLYQFVGRLVREAEEDVAEGRGRHWDLWLETMETMGQRILAASEANALGARAGVFIQLQAVGLRERVNDLESAGDAERLAGRRARLEVASRLLDDLENSRDVLIAADRERHLLPLRLIGWTFLLLGAVVGVSVPACRLSREHRQHRTVPHGRAGQIFFLIVPAASFALLGVAAVTARAWAVADVALVVIPVLWWGLWGTALLLGIAYPMTVLPPARHAASRLAGPESPADPELARAARRVRLAAAVCLARRYYGVLLGGFACAVCFWVLLYRVFVALYPWQLRLLTTGLSDEASAVVRRVLELLA